MKKTFLIIGSVLLFLLVTAITIPFLFKDQIKAKVNAEIEKNISAKVFYGDLNLSLFKNFPQITLTLNNFGIVGIAPFAGDTLVAANAFHTSFDVMSIFKKETIKVNFVEFDQPKINLKVLKDGTNNYDIYKKSVDNEQVTKSHNFAAQLNSWTINQGEIKYDNSQIPAFVSLSNINHEGNGDISQQIFDLNSTTSIEKTIVNYKGQSYLKNRKITFEGPVNIDLNQSIYALQKGKLQINDFPIELAGNIHMPDTNINLDVTFKTKENEDFKKLISLIPAFYTKEYNDIKTEGNFTVTGKTKGIYNAHTMPAFDISINVNKGRIQFPALSVPISDINFKAFIENKTDKLQNTSIDIKNFNLNLGKNPIKGHVLLTGLQNSKVDADVKGNIDLAEITKIFPMKGLSLKGNLNADIVAKGYYTKNEFPKITGKLNLKNGYAKSADFPEAIENILLTASILNTSGKPSDTKIDLSDALLIMQGEPFMLKGTIQNLKNVQWDLAAKGKLDFTKITKIFPIDGTKIKGKIEADITTKGQMEAIKSKNYQNLNVIGTAKLQDFEYESIDFPQPFSAKSADLSFTPTQIIAKNASGFLGKSDYEGTGTFGNYFGYVFNNEVLNGNLNVTSKVFNMNEWMDDSPSSSTKTLEATTLRAVEIPKDLDLKINAIVGETAYEKMKIGNAKGNIIVNNGKVQLQNVTFNALGGSFITNGSYNSSDIVHPKFDFDLDLAKVEIVQAYQHLWVVRNLVPIAEYLLGNFTSKVKIGGELGQDMVPKLMSLTGEGLVKLIKAAVKENPIIKEVADKTKIPVLQNIVLQDILMQTEVKNGRMGFKPFSFNIKDYKFSVGGFNALDGSLDWAIGVDAPTGKIGQGFNDLFKTWTGKTLSGTDRVAFDLQMGGTFKQPKVVFKGSKTANSIKETVTAEAKAQIEAAKAKAQAELDKLKTEAEAKKKELEDKATAEIERLKTEAEAKKKELEDKAKAEIARLKKEAEDQAKAEIEKLKKIADDKIAEEKAKLEKIAQEKRKELEAKIKAKLDSTSRANAEKLRKALEDKAKAAVEEKRKAAEAKAKAAEEKLKQEADAKIKAAEEKAKQELEERKKAAEDELKKAVKDTTKN